MNKSANKIVRKDEMNTWCVDGANDVRLCVEPELRIYLCLDLDLNFLGADASDFMCC